MARPSYEIVEHTADVGFVVRAPDRAALFETAALVLADLIVDVDAVRATERFDLEARGADDGELLVAWLSEILSLHDARGLVFSRFEVSHCGARELSGAAWGEPLDWARHEPRTLVKAVTYHGLEVAEEAGGYRARVLLDV